MSGVHEEAAVDPEHTTQVSEESDIIAAFEDAASDCSGQRTSSVRVSTAVDATAAACASGVHAVAPLREVANTLSGGAPRLSAMPSTMDQIAALSNEQLQLRLDESIAQLGTVQDTLRYCIPTS